MQSVHEGLAHNCELCDYKASQKINLNQHMESVHDEVKHSCEFNIKRKRR